MLFRSISEPGHLRAVADHLAAVELCSEIHSIAGDYDLLVKLYVKDLDHLADLVADTIQKVPHLRETHSIPTFRTYKLPPGE